MLHTQMSETQLRQRLAIQAGTEQVVTDSFITNMAVTVSEMEMLILHVLGEGETNENVLREHAMARARAQPFHTWYERGVVKDKKDDWELQEEIMYTGFWKIPGLKLGHMWQIFWSFTLSVTAITQVCACGMTPSLINSHCLV